MTYSIHCEEGHSSCKRVVGEWKGLKMTREVARIHARVTGETVEVWDDQDSVIERYKGEDK